MRRRFRIPWRRRRRRSCCTVGFRRLQSDGGCYWAHRSPCHSFSLSPYQNNAFFCDWFLSFNNSAANCIFFFKSKNDVSFNYALYNTSQFLYLWDFIFHTVEGRAELQKKIRYNLSLSLSLSLYITQIVILVLIFHVLPFTFNFDLVAFFNQWWKCGSYLEL